MTIALATSTEFPALEPDSRLLLPEIAARAIDARPAVWNDARVDWSAFDAIVIRSTWDYFHHAREWAAWLDAIEALGIPMLNPLEVIRWNSHKSYLRELASAGVPVVDTVMTQGDAPVDLADLLSGAGWEDAIVKPAIDGGAARLFRVRDADDPQARFDELVGMGDVLVQPFLPSIETEGEVSLLYFGRELSHTVRKTARPGDIRVQPVWGGHAETIDPTAEMVHVAERTFGAIDADLLYARVDLVRALDGTLRLIELEVIEPLLFLELDPAAPGRFADALAARLAALRA
jgi:glutathione synthase/RimK-type ligase-like ATP-grasp enzyme